MSVAVRKNKRKAETPQKNRVRVTPAIQASVAKLLSLFPAHNDRFVAPVFDNDTKKWQCAKVEVCPTTLRLGAMMWRRAKMSRAVASDVFNALDETGVKSHYFHIADLIAIVLDYITLQTAYVPFKASDGVQYYCTTDFIDVTETQFKYETVTVEPVDSMDFPAFFHSGRKAGKGLFATEDLEPGTIIGPYLGSIHGEKAHGDYVLRHWVADDSKIGQKVEYSIDGTPVVPDLQVVSYTNEPDYAATANCSFVFGIIPGVDIKPLYLVVTSYIKTGYELTVGYGRNYLRDGYKPGKPSDVLVSPVILSFEQSMQVVHLYGLFNPGLEECVRAVFAPSSSSSSAAAAASDE